MYFELKGKFQNAYLLWADNGIKAQFDYGAQKNGSKK